MTSPSPVVRAAVEEALELAGTRAKATRLLKQRFPGMSEESLRCLLRDDCALGVTIWRRLGAVGRAA